MTRKTKPATIHADGLATMTAPGGIRIAISMRYYQHPRGMLAATANEREGAVYEAFGYEPITQKQHAAATGRREREDARYERDVAQLVKRTRRRG